MKDFRNNIIGYGRFETEEYAIRRYIEFIVKNADVLVTHYNGMTTYIRYDELCSLRHKFVNVINGEVKSAGQSLEQYKCVFGEIKSVEAINKYYEYMEFENTFHAYLFEKAGN